MMADDARNGRYLGGDIADRQITELTGMARGLIADGALCDTEVQFLHKWLVASDHARAHPLLSRLVARIETVLADGVVDDDERVDLMATLRALTAADFELGEPARSSTLPLCDPPPPLAFEGMRYCLTGTFTFGTRAACEAATASRGAIIGGLTRKTDVLVIGDYATHAWKQSSFGRKIEQAVGWRDTGLAIAVVSETHWRAALRGPLA